MKRFLLPIIICLFLIFVSACSNTTTDQQTNNTPEETVEPVSDQTQQSTASESSSTQTQESTSDSKPSQTQESASNSISTQTQESTKTESESNQSQESAKSEETSKPASNQTTTQNQESTQKPTTIKFTVEGDYKMFGVANNGLLVKSSDLEMESDITLKEGGTGVMSFDGDSMDITEWVLNKDVVSLTLADGGKADAKVHDGILELDLYGDGSMVMYFAQEGADISVYEFLTLEEVREKNKEN